ncbi:hypothetical protein [Echinicola vietnamensis]|uniref:Uncharacterized protein n=1 Tax=Echinicola vietnamensis (strain DSM 17526 / LMG 23754 / KMM 6221) TaxID=926556 RepID=L0G4L4_ECHVK|nr:hypothetical protein [Echinicola vietnamensis]AGA79770.1 hypothetical protein Echvi_3554 [Echinicola vietnamensis DSM 17526]
MFDSSDYPQALDEALFESWLEEGRAMKIPYQYMVIIWNVMEEVYQPAYVQDRDALSEFERYPTNTGQEGLVAVFNLYSESRVTLP